jgi:hypothetical protein
MVLVALAITRWGIKGVFDFDPERVITMRSLRLWLPFL